MPHDQTPPKPSAAEQQSGKGLDAATCSASDEVRRMVFAFDDYGRQREVRRIAARVKALEDALRGMRDHYRQWAIPGTLQNQVEAALGSPNDKLTRAVGDED